MAGVKDFAALGFWQKARQWSNDIFRLTRREPFRSDRRLVAQVNDSSESVAANIAEGFRRGTQGEFVTFLGYAIGSLNETQSHLSAAYDREYLSKDEFAGMYRQGTEIRKMTVAFIRSMVQPGSGVKHVRKVRSFTDDVWERYERITGRPRPEWFRRPPADEEDGDVPGPRR